MYYYILSCKHLFEDLYSYNRGESVICEVTRCGTQAIVKEYENGDYVALI